MKAKEWKSSLMLLLTAAIWGVAFVAQSVGMDYIGPFTFNAIRSLVGGLVLIPCIWLLNRKKPAAQEDTPAQSGRTLFIGGIYCGVALAVASSLQQMEFSILRWERRALLPHFILSLCRCWVTV